MPTQPNILFVLTDQQRADTVGADPQALSDGSEPVPHTPNLDHLAAEGVLFDRHYSPSPSSIPARRSLLTGQTPATNGCPGWTTEPWNLDRTLAGELTAAGYQTRLVGKIHSIPNRNHCGFEHLVQHEGLHTFPEDDYAQWLADRVEASGAELAGGLGRNAWDPRPWHYPEEYHPTRWTTERALEFLETRDPTRPFFLNLSYVRPHTPFDPPADYFEQYVDRNLPVPPIGEWSDEWFGEYLSDRPAPDAWIADLPERVVHRARAAYLGLVTQIDHQLKRVFDRLRVDDEWEDTLVVFASDHGEMLGDHHLWRKSYPFEGSARVPLIVRPPGSVDVERGAVRHHPVGLHDLMPTMLDVANVDIPGTVEGRSLVGLLDGDAEDWRTYYHGEHAPIYAPENGTQFLVDESTKYIWNTVTGAELLFDLETDPTETVDRSDDPAYADQLAAMRGALVDRLADREEDFVRHGDLYAAERPVAEA
jgi:arylsulfatase A-like enzyme